MSSELHLVFHNIERDQHLVDFIEARFNHLTQLLKCILGCRVAITKSRLKQLNYDQYKVCINLVASGLRIIARSHHEFQNKDVYTSISEAFDSLDIQLKLNEHCFSNNSPKQQLDTDSMKDPLAIRPIERGC